MTTTPYGRLDQENADLNGRLEDAEAQNRTLTRALDEVQREFREEQRLLEQARRWAVALEQENAVLAAEINRGRHEFRPCPGQPVVCGNGTYTGHGVPDELWCGRTADHPDHRTSAVVLAGLNANGEATA